jgi:argininosuccinate lyase
MVGRLVLESVRTRKTPADWNAEQLAEFSADFTPEIARMLDVGEGIKTRTVPGGTAPDTVAAALAAAEERLSKVV